MTNHKKTTAQPSADDLLKVIKKYWGYDALRPMQLEAMQASCARQDSLAVMPTGGGKSLCYQAPALLIDKPTVVISPLIALMKDQVDSLLEREIPAAFLNSSLDTEERRIVESGIANNRYKLLFVAPERFANSYFVSLLQKSGVGSFAIDEAHCISHWGHDFRDDYRKLGLLKEKFPSAGVHAFTATATPRVRQDICDQLKLVDPQILVGDFFRPNLIYRTYRRNKIFDDVAREVNARNRQGGIVYCIRRDDVDAMAQYLIREGVKAAGYHAGMSDDERTRTQDAFAAGEIDVVVATVAFGMGIDRSDIRFVIHAAMPKSIEHYQQETGRAGRDGKEAECILFYSGADFGLWKSIIDGNDPTHGQRFINMLSEMYRFCTGVTCRHKKLVTYFGQKWDRDSCGACDVCNDGLEQLPDSTVIAQKIMSAIVRTGQRYGSTYVCEVLIGCESQQVTTRGHDQQSTFGIMRDNDRKELLGWIDQLVDQELIEREAQYRVLKITPAGWEVLHSKAEARLLPIEIKAKAKSSRRKSKRSFARTYDEVYNDDVYADDIYTDEMPQISRTSMLDSRSSVLFEKLKSLRKEIAAELNAPAFVVFGDKTLRAIARAKPLDKDSMLKVKGVGPAKFNSYGQRFLDAIHEFVG